MTPHAPSKTVFPPRRPEDDAKLSWTEQAWSHHRLFYDLFKPGVSSKRIQASIPRIQAFIDRRTKILFPTTLRDISEKAMRKFFFDHWPEGREDSIGSLMTAYFKAGYLDVNSTCPLKSIGEHDAVQAGDRPLLQQVLDMSSAVFGNGLSQASHIQRLVQSLIDAGADLSAVPSVDLQINNMSLSTLVKRGDILAYTEAKHGPGSRTTAFVQTLVMNSKILAAQGASTSPSTTEAKPRRLDL